jgi:type IV pilus biogenesis protein CpaD/CtpE
VMRPDRARPKRQVRKHCIGVAALLLAAGCDNAYRSQTPAIADDTTQSKQTVAKIEADVRLDVALKRIDRLEREVAELKAGPAPIDNELLRQELAITKKALASASPPTAAAPKTATDQKTDTSPRAEPLPRAAGRAPLKPDPQ